MQLSCFLSAYQEQYHHSSSDDNHTTATFQDDCGVGGEGKNGVAAAAVASSSSAAAAAAAAVKPTLLCFNVKVARTLVVGRWLRACRCPRRSRHYRTPLIANLKPNSLTRRRHARLRSYRPSRCSYLVVPGIGTEGRHLVRAWLIPPSCSLNAKLMRPIIRMPARR